MTLPLSYSRKASRSALKSCSTSCPSTRFARSGHSTCPCELAHGPLHSWLAMSEARRAESNGGEGRTRTFEGAGPTDLQSAAFDRFATSPMRFVWIDLLRQLELMELAKGFEPPTG